MKPIPYPIESARREDLNLDPSGPHSSNYIRVPYEERDLLPFRIVMPILAVFAVIAGGLVYAASVCGLSQIFH